MAKYDPSKQYKWEETDEFVMTGNQFGLMLNAIRNYLSKPESQEVMLMQKAESEMTKLLIEGVESGVVIEVAPKPLPSSEGLESTPMVRKPKMVVKK